MSYLLGEPLHLCFVVPDLEAELARYAAGGIGPFWRLDSTGGIGRYRGGDHPVNMSAAFFYSGQAAWEIIAVHDAGEQSAWGEFIRRNPAGGLHHVAYQSDDFEASLARMAAAGKPLDVVQEFHDREGNLVEIYCEPRGAENPIFTQFVKPGMYDRWFDLMRDAAAAWDGAEPMRDARAAMAQAMRG